MTETGVPPFVSFLSDYGHADEFVGVCKAVIASFAPEATVIDITHDVPAFDVRAASLALVRSVQYLPGGVVLAVVDPGVGTARRAIAVEVDGAYFVGPDNGLLAPAVAMVGGARRAVECTNSEFHLDAPGPTFAGRDVFAPVAANLAAGVPITEFGPEIDPVTLLPGLVGLPRRDRGGALIGEIWWVDHFGNCQLNIDPEELAAAGATLDGPVEVHFANQTRVARWVHTYADAKPSELVIVVDSYGLCSLAFDRDSVAAEWNLKAGSSVTLVPPGASITGEEEGPS